MTLTRKIAANSPDAIRRVSLFAVLILMIPACVRAQNTIAPKPLKDTASVVALKPTHSPTTALLLSLLPGGGQVYNHQAWKIPIIYAALGTVGYFTYSNYTQMKTFKDEYLYRVNHDGATNLAGYEDRPTQNIYNLYESYNKNFQLFIFIDIAVYALNLIDAYVFGHLFDFEVEDNLALTPQVHYLPQLGMTTGMSLTLRF